MLVVILAAEELTASRDLPSPLPPAQLLNHCLIQSCPTPKQCSRPLLVPQMLPRGLYPCISGFGYNTANLFSSTSIKKKKKRMWSVTRFIFSESFEPTNFLIWKTFVKIIVSCGKQPSPASPCKPYAGTVEVKANT